MNIDEHLVFGTGMIINIFLAFQKVYYLRMSNL